MQHPKRLLARWHTDPEIGFSYRYVISQSERFIEHFHDFYEVFLVTEGEVIHTVNGVTITLRKGALVFIRPSDVHMYTYDGINNFCFANLSFASHIAEKLFAYLDGGSNIQFLISCEMPPTVWLTSVEAEKLFYDMQSINTASYTDNNEKILRMKTVIFNIFSKYFSKYSITENSYPVWFEYLCEQLKKPAIFQKLHPDMPSMCGKSKEHISRCFKKYLGVTPSDYLNDIRLNYAANLLKNTDISILEVSLESGFENLSWFYRKFNEKYGLTPKKFRFT